MDWGRKVTKQVCCMQLNWVHSTMHLDTTYTCPHGMHCTNHIVAACCMPALSNHRWLPNEVNHKASKSCVLFSCTDNNACQCIGASCSYWTVLL